MEVVGLACGQEESGTLLVSFVELCHSNEPWRL